MDLNGYMPVKQTVAPNPIDMGVDRLVSLEQSATNINYESLLSERTHKRHVRSNFNTKVWI